MDTFSNSIISPENLPEISSKEFTGLNRKYLTLIIIRIIIFFLLMCIGLVAFIMLSEGLPVRIVSITGASAILFITLILVTTSILGFPRKGYLVREQDVSFQKGLITYKLTTIPFNRIQHVEVNQGVASKIFGLSSVKIFTAGGSYSDLTIPGLPTEVAHRLKSYLSDQISRHE